jgi:hypothetical protein
VLDSNDSTRLYTILVVGTQTDGRVCVCFLLFAVVAFILRLAFYNHYLFTMISRVAALARARANVQVRRWASSQVSTSSSGGGGSSPFNAFARGWYNLYVHFTWISRIYRYIISHQRPLGVISYYNILTDLSPNLIIAFLLRRYRFGASTARYASFLVVGAILAEMGTNGLTDTLWEMNNRGQTYQQVDWSKFDPQDDEEEEEEEEEEEDDDDE